MIRFDFDFETFLIQPGLLAPPPVCASFRVDNGRGEILHVRDPAFYRTLEWAWTDPQVELRAHNAAFEVVVSMAYCRDWTPAIFAKLADGKVRCTLTREKLISIGRGDGRLKFGLDACCEAWDLPVPNKQDHWRVRYGLLLDVPVSEWPQEARDYSLGDLVVGDLFERQATCDPRFFVWEAESLEAAVDLQLTSCTGFPTDPEYAEELYQQTQEEMDQIRDELVEAGLLRVEVHHGVPKYVRDQKAAAALCETAYNLQGREPPRGALTPAAAKKGAKLGNVKLDEEACLLSGNDLLKKYTTYGQANTLFKKIRRAKFPIIQCSYNSLVETGRTSCRLGEDPKPGQPYTTFGSQMQNMPRE